MGQYVVVKDLTCLYAIQNHEPGEMAYCEDTKEIYMWDEDKGWQKMDVNNEGIDLNLYELNKSIVNQLDPMTEEEIKSYSDLITKYKEDSRNDHHMLLCRDYNYYTIFEWTEFPPFIKFADAIIEIISDLGDVYSIEQLIDGAVEIWIKPTEEETPYAFYLFPYDAGVVYYG